MLSMKLMAYLFQEFIWFWSDGSKFEYNDWHTGEPNNDAGRERCAEMGYGGNISTAVHILNLQYLTQIV